MFASLVGVAPYIVIRESTKRTAGIHRIIIIIIIAVVVVVIILLFRVFSDHYQLMVFHRILSDSKSL